MIYRQCHYFNYMPVPHNDQTFPRTCLEDLRRTSAMAAGVNQILLRSVKRSRSCKEGTQSGNQRGSHRMDLGGILITGTSTKICREFQICLRQGPHPLPPPHQFNGHQVSFSGVKRPERRADHPPPFSAEVRGTAELTLWAFMGCHRVDFTFNPYLTWPTGSPAVRLSVCVCVNLESH
jgi:hypothetical protein